MTSRNLGAILVASAAGLMFTAPAPAQQHESNPEATRALEAVVKAYRDRPALTVHRLNARFRFRAVEGGGFDGREFAVSLRPRVIDDQNVLDWSAHCSGPSGLFDEQRVNENGLVQVLNDRINRQTSCSVINKVIHHI